ncbi:hypothetical protein LED50_03785 [Salmonella enterica]|nr:hypothetical protein [Salmonella enterica]
MTTNKLTDETLSAWKTEAKISLGETARDSVDYSHHEAILALVTEIQEHRKAAAEPVLYVMGMGCAFDAETASTCKGAVDSWVGEWNQERLPGQEEYKTVPLYTVPPVQETGVYKDMLNIIGLLENNEWDEHCASTVLGSLLESEITRLVGKEQPVPVVPDECPDELLAFCEQVIDSRITANAKADELWNACRAAMLQSSQPVSNHDELPYAQVKAVADLYALCWQSGEVVTYTPDPEKATIWLNNYSGTCVQEYVKLERLQEALAGNSPVIPDDWVMVPKEPTQAMISAWLSEVANWRGHAAGYRAALAAAPQQEGNNG